MTHDKDAIDVDALREITGGDEALERSLFAQFRTVGEEDMASLREAVARKDLMVAARAAHRLKGASATIGATHLAALCQRCEHSARNGQLGPVEDGLDELEAQLRSVIAFVERLYGDR